MKLFPKYKKTFFYRILSALLQSLMGICFLLLASLGLTTLLFNLANQYLEKKASWSKGWSQRISESELQKSKCHSITKAYPHEKQCGNIAHIPLVDLDTTNNKIWEQLDETLKNRDEKQLAKENAFYITQIGKNEPEGTLPKEKKPYIASYSLLELSFTENLNKRSLQARLWVVAVDQKQKSSFSQTLQISLLHQEKWLSGLWPTQTLLEPGNIGRWFVHNLQNITKEHFNAGYLLIESNILKRNEIFLNALAEKTFGHPHQSFNQDAFWFTFFNGVNYWGFIQWASVFLGLFVLLQLSLRSCMTQFESNLFSSYQNTHPFDFQKHEDPSILHGLREAFAKKPSLFPHFQSFFLLRIIDGEAKNMEEILSQKIERSRRIIDFLISSLSSIGFIGTITGIAFAINQAHQVVTPDEFLRLQAIKSLSTDLALAFSTTFVALVLTLVCDFFAKLQWQDEDLLLEKLQATRQAWAWQKKEEPAEQAKVSFHVEL